MERRLNERFEEELGEPISIAVTSNIVTGRWLRSVPIALVALVVSRFFSQAFIQGSILGLGVGLSFYFIASIDDRRIRREGSQPGGALPILALTESSVVLIDKTVWGVSANATLAAQRPLSSIESIDPPRRRTRTVTFTFDDGKAWTISPVGRWMSLFDELPDRLKGE